VDKRPVLTVSEAAELLGVSRAFAYELVARGELPAVRLGRRIMIPRVGIQRIIENSVAELQPPA
jgi:excisionase family DNA binding protein